MWFEVLSVLFVIVSLLCPLLVQALFSSSFSWLSVLITVIYLGCLSLFVFYPVLLCVCFGHETERDVHDMKKWRFT